VRCAAAGWLAELLRGCHGARYECYLHGYSAASSDDRKRSSDVVSVAVLDVCLSAGALSDATMTRLVRSSAMQRLRIGRLIVIIGLTLTVYDSTVSTSGADEHGDYSDDVINAARCRVRCLSLLQVS